MKETIKQAAIKFANKYLLANIAGGLDNPYDEMDMINAFEEGAEFQAKQNQWHNFKDERPKSNSHILRRMIHPGYESYGKIIYYADFWNEYRPDKWEQENDKVVYEWQYINE